MSNPDSFIDEVSEELRRDRLYGLFRRYGWIGGVVILVIVGGTAFTQWSKAREAARAEGFGDALIDALDTGSPEARREALAAVPATGTQVVIRDLIAASDPGEDREATLAALDAVIADTTLAPAWRDLAILRRVGVAGADMPLAERRASLEGIAGAGRPYRALAAEQLAYLLIEEGDSAGAIQALVALTTAEDAGASLRARAGQVVTALGGAPAVPASAGAEAAAPAAEEQED
ncbi:hypothetical protein [Pseudogemmobacter humi]|uniref:Tetratricopeptide repeat-like domain-containing protein n=1 Tax=Pseudogemmobacter humi TaxID=2483812 RepID=A0A3P5XI30_9RHOB|nr:hypothetical protein [Pseudogemmobacter humi]VDC30554.1 hypothetical protein XINFAN_02580 [Pseudogemmobacter humi]